MASVINLQNASKKAAHKAAAKMNLTPGEIAAAELLSANRQAKTSTGVLNERHQKTHKTNKPRRKKLRK